MHFFPPRPSFPCHESDQKRDKQSEVRPHHGIRRESPGAHHTRPVSRAAKRCKPPPRDPSFPGPDAVPRAMVSYALDMTPQARMMLSV